jgi:hypothetical protein
MLPTLLVGETDCLQTSTEFMSSGGQGGGTPMARVLFLACALALATVGASNAQVSAPPGEIGVIANQFLSDLKAGKSSEAFHFAFKDLEASLGTTTVENVAAQTSAALKTFGTIQKWSSFKTDFVTPSLVRQTYYVECKDVPLFLTIQFYNGGGGWHVIDIQLNTYSNAKEKGYLDQVYTQSAH